MAALLQSSKSIAGDKSRIPSIHSRPRCGHVDRGRICIASAAQKETSSTIRRTGKDKPDWTGSMPAIRAQYPHLTLQKLISTVSPISTFVGRYCDKLAILLFAVLVAGDALLSRMVNAAVGIKPLFAVMKVAAKQVLKSTAERNGVPWDSTVQQLQNTPEVLYICKPVTRSCTLSHILPPPWIARLPCSASPS